MNRIRLEKKKFIATPARSKVVDESSGRSRVSIHTTPTATIAPAKAATEASWDTSSGRIDSSGDWSACRSGADSGVRQVAITPQPRSAY